MPAPGQRDARPAALQPAARGSAPTRGSRRSRTARTARAARATASASAARSPRSCWVMPPYARATARLYGWPTSRARCDRSSPLAGAASSSPSSQWACAAQARRGCRAGCRRSATSSPSPACGRARVRSASAGRPSTMADPPTREMRRAAQLGVRRRTRCSARVAVWCAVGDVAPGRTGTPTARRRPLSSESRGRALGQLDRALERPPAARGRRSRTGRSAAPPSASRTSSSCRRGPGPGGSRPHDRPAPAVQPDRLGVREDAARDLGRPPVVGDRPIGPAAAGVLLGQLGRRRRRCRRRAATPGPGRGAGAAATAAAG